MCAHALSFFLSHVWKMLMFYGMPLGCHWGCHWDAIGTPLGCCSGAHAALIPNENCDHERLFLFCLFLKFVSERKEAIRTIFGSFFPVAFPRCFAESLSVSYFVPKALTAPSTTSARHQYSGCLVASTLESVVHSVVTALRRLL